MKKTTLAIAGATAIALATTSIAQEFAQTQKPTQQAQKVEQQLPRQIRYADPNNCDFSNLTDEEIMFMGLAPREQSMTEYIDIRFFNNTKYVKDDIKKHKQSGLSKELKNNKNAKVILIFSCCKKVKFADMHRLMDDNEMEKYYMELLGQHKNCPRATTKNFFHNDEELRNLIRDDLQKRFDQWQYCNEKLIKAKETIARKSKEESLKPIEQKKREQQFTPEPQKEPNVETTTPSALAQDSSKVIQHKAQTKQQPTTVRQLNPNRCDLGNFTNDEIMKLQPIKPVQSTTQYIPQLFINDNFTTNSLIRRHKHSGMSKKIRFDINTKVIIHFACCNKTTFADMSKLTNDKDMKKYYRGLFKEHSQCPRASRKNFSFDVAMEKLVTADLDAWYDSVNKCNEKLMEEKKSVVLKQRVDKPKGQKQPAPEPQKKSRTKEIKRNKIPALKEEQKSIEPEIILQR